MKILIISTGGTIASKKDDNIHLDAPFKVVHFADENLIKGVEFSFSCPYTILSENMDFSHLQSLVDEIKESDSDNIIILHGSDTLAFTSSFIANLFWDKNIVLTASDKPIEDNLANGISNFNEALRHIKKGEKGVFVSYDGIFPADTITSADGLDKFRQTGKSQPKFKNPCLAPKNILVIKPYTNIDYNNYNIESADLVLHEMYHSATVPESAKAFAKKCRQSGVPFYFATPKSSADYETSADISDMIIFNTTLENAFARFNISQAGD